MLKIDSFDFVDILHEVRDLKPLFWENSHSVHVDSNGHKIAWNIHFADFGHFWLKNGLSCILLNIASLDFF